MTTELYIPPNCKNLQTTENNQQIRLGLQGYGGTGKTWAALTFPNCIVLNLDRGLGAHVGRSDVIDVPIYNHSFCRSIIKTFTPPDVKDVVIKWIETEGAKLSPIQTLVIDGNTGLQNAYHKWYNANQTLFLTKDGKIDGFAEWNQKKVFYGDILETLKTLQCNVVYMCHEADQKDKNGVTGPTYSGKVRPLLTGAIGDEIVSHFTDWFRQHCTEKPVLDSVTDDTLKKWGMNKLEFGAMMKSFPENAIYYWQTEGDTIFDAKRSSLVGAPKFIPARYESFLKYRRK